jgi:hypothetical protein
MSSLLDSKVAMQASPVLGGETSGATARGGDSAVVVNTITGGRRRRKSSKKSKKSKARKSSKGRRSTRSSRSSRSYRRPMFLL